jgi:hypothetical protein
MLNTYSERTGNPVSVDGRSAQFKGIRFLFRIANGGSHVFIVYLI